MKKDNSTILEKVKALFKEEEKKEVTLESMKTKDDTSIFAESFAPGEAVFIEQEEERIALPVGEYELEDGRMLIVVEEGIIDSIAEAVAEEAPAEEEVVEEEMSEDDKLRSIIKEVISEMQKEEMQSFVDQMNAQIETMSADFTKKVEDLSTELSQIPKVDKPTYKPEGRKVTLNLKSNDRKLTTKEKVYEKLYSNTSSNY